jgi:hypothetical protein
MSDTSERPPVTQPTVDSEGGVQTDDFGLKPDLKEMLVEALEKRWTDPENPPTTLDDEPAGDAPAQQHPGIPTEDSADTAATPAPAPSPTPGSDGQGLGAGAGGGGDAAGEGAAPDPASAPPSAPTSQEEFDLNSYARDYFGTDLTPAQSRELFRLFGGLQAMTDEQRMQVDQILAGGRPGVYPGTTGQPPLTQGYNPALEPPGQQPPAIPGLPPRPDDEYEAAIYDKLIAPFAQTIAQQVGGMQQEIALSTQQRLEAERQRSIAQIEEAQNAWKAKYPVITDGEFDALTDRVVRGGQFPALVASLGPARATEQILEQHLWTDENLRNRILANVASGRAPGDPATVDPTSPVAQQAADAASGRQARAASVAGGGGAPTTHTPKAPTTKQERHDAMIRELEATMQQ